MDWMNVLNRVFEILVYPIMGALAIWLVSIIKKKQTENTKESEQTIAEKYLKYLDNVIRTCVERTNQTYVDDLKSEEMFDADAMEEAFQMTFNSVKEILSDDIKEVLERVYGDLDEYISSKIEEEVHFSK